MGTTTARPPTTTARPSTTTARPPTTTARTTMAITTDIGVTTIEHATTSSGTTILKQSVEWRSADNSSSKNISTFFSSTTNRIAVVAGGATVGVIVLLILGFLITRHCKKRNKSTKRSESTRQMMSAVSGAHGVGDQMGSENPYYVDPKQINARMSPVSGARDEGVSAAQSQMDVPNNEDAENTGGKSVYVDFDTDVPNIGDAVYADIDDTDKVTTKDGVCENDAYDTVRYQAKAPAAPGDQTGSENLYLVPKEILDRMPTASNENCENEVYANV